MTSTTTSFRSLIVIAVMAILLMSFVPVIIRWTSANEITIGIIRLGIGACGLGLILLWRGKAIKITRFDLAWLSLLGLVFAVHWYAYFKSIKLAGASLAAIGVATFGVHLLVLNSIILKEKLRSTDLFAVVLSFTGIYIASPSFDLSSASLKGFAIAVLSGFLYACLPLINRRIAHLPTNTRALGQFSFALLVFSAMLPEANFNLSYFDWSGLIFLGVVSTLVAHTFWLKASTELPTNITAVIYYGYVPLAMLFSYVFLDETITWQKMVGASLIISANILVALLHRRTALRAK